MSLEIRKIAGGEHVGITVLVEISNLRPCCSIHRKKQALAKVVAAIIFQDPNPVIRLEDPGIIEVVAVHMDDIHVPVAVEIVHGEVHRPVRGWKARQYARPLGESPFSIVLEQHYSL